jgi:DNA-binding HxlR family transcriptional regulator
VEYEPSTLATTLIPHAVALANWAVQHNSDIAAHRDAYDSRGR